MVPAKCGTNVYKKMVNGLNQNLPASQRIFQGGNQSYNKSYYWCDDSYTKVFLMRDPLTRLLSGYLDKCTVKCNECACANYLVTVGVAYEDGKFTGNRSDSVDNTFLRFTEWIVDQKKNGLQIDGTYMGHILFSSKKRASFMFLVFCFVCH